MVYELIAYNTDCRFPQDIRYREYTTSKKRAEAFEKIPKIQFTDSGHGIVFNAREMKSGEHRKQVISICGVYVREHLARLQREGR